MIKNLQQCFEGGINSYTDAGDERKRRFHSLGRARLRALARELGLKKGEYEVRSNKGGMAVSGEVILHTDPVIKIDLGGGDYAERGAYVQLSQSCMGPGSEIMFRSCKHSKDYTGGSNNFRPIHAIAQAGELAKQIKYGILHF